MTKAHAAPQNDNLPRAISAIVFAVLALSLGDAIIKSFSVSFSLWQIYVLRSAIVLPVLFVFTKTQKLQPNATGWVAIRSLLLALMWVAYYAALPHLQLSVAAAAFYTLPLFITLFSALFTKEQIGKTGWLAIGLGFAGVLVILRPDADGLNIYAFLPVLAAILYAIAMILTRTKCRDESPYILSLSLNIAFVLVGGIISVGLVIVDWEMAMVSKNLFLLGGWVSPDRAGFFALLVMAAAMLIGSIFTAVAYQSASSSTVSSFDYAYLAFGVLWGVLFFAEFPDGVTMLGIAMIATAGIMAARR